MKKIISNEEWEKAYNHCKEFYSLYLEIGLTGVFGAHFIAILIQRYENGERNQELYEDMISVQ